MRPGADECTLYADTETLLLDATFFPGRAAKVIYRPKGNPPYSSSQMSQSPATAAQKPTEAAFVHSPTTADEPKSSAFDSLKATFSSALPSLDKSASHDVDIGVIGVLHPSVLEKFEITFPCSALEFTLEPFMKEITPVWADEP